MCEGPTLTAEFRSVRGFYQQGKECDFSVMGNGQDPGLHFTESSLAAAWKADGNPQRLGQSEEGTWTEDMPRSLINSWNLEMPAPGPWLAGGKGGEAWRKGSPESGRLWLYQEKNLLTSCLSCPAWGQIYLDSILFPEITLRGFWPVCL